VDPEENEERGSGRSQNVVHTLPRSMASVPGFLTGPLERIDPAAGSTQVLVLTSDAESAVALAEAALRLTGPAGIELLPVTTARRAGRLMAGRPVLAVVGAPREIRDLVRASHLKLDSVRAVVLAWADEILAGDVEDIESLEAVMSELPKDAARIVVTSRSEGRVNAFAERYLRRAHRDAPAEAEGTTPVPVQYVTVSASSRLTALRRLLDDMDPPSAVVIAQNEQTEDFVSRSLKVLGYGPTSSAVTVSRQEIAPSTYAVIFYEMPSSRAQLAAAAEASPVSIVALTEPREIQALRQMSGGDVRPFTLSAPGNAARQREASIRRELSSVIDSGLAARDILALEPLLDRHDGIEIAAAALRLLEKERALAAHREEKPRAIPVAAEVSRPAGRPGTRPEGREGGREGGRDRDRSSAGGRGFARGSGPRPGGSRDSRPGPRDSGGRGQRDGGGPRDRPSRPDSGPRDRPSRPDGGDRRPPRDGYSRPPRRDR